MHLVYFFAFLLIRWTLATDGKSLASPDASIDTSLVNEPNIDDSPTEVEPTCKVQPLGLEDVEFLKGDNIFLKDYNATIHITSSELFKNDSHICFNRSNELKAEIFRVCQKWVYESDEYTVLANGSVMLYDEILESGTFQVKDDELLTCAVEENEPSDNSTNRRHLTDQDKLFIDVGQIGSSISIIALIAHLIMFGLVPSLRNLPGYNLASLSVAFLFGYSFSLIGQIPEVLGLFCVVSGMLQQNFFLAAFFCMNVMAIDIWRTLRLATKKFAISTDNVKRRQFVFYTIYSWGSPLLITTAAILADNLDSVPESIRPNFGRDDTCWMTNNIAKAIFFSIPAFTLFIVNGVFFVLSAFIIKNNTMKSTNDQHRLNARRNFVLYVRLGLMMGVTWLLGVLAAAFKSKALWLISDTLNSLQGLFVFLLFTCSRKVFNCIKAKVNSRTSKVTSADKHTTSTIKSFETTNPSVNPSVNQ